MQRVFRRFAHKSAEAVGSPWAFFAAVLLILLWGITGPIFGFSDTWQLVINTTTTIITFLMVFLIQHTQNRDAKAIQLKLDELIRSVEGARDSLVDAEDLSEEELKQLFEEFRQIHEAASRGDGRAMVAARVGLRQRLLERIRSRRG